MDGVFYFTFSMVGIFERLLCMDDRWIPASSVIGLNDWG